MQASYEVDLWGRLARLSDSALVSFEGQRAASDAAQLSIAATVASGYFNLRGLDAQLALARETLSSREESLARARRLLDAGYSSRLDWAQAESEFRSAAAAVPALERSVAQQEHALAMLPGRNPRPLARRRSITELVPPTIDAGLPSALLRRRRHRAGRVPARCCGPQPQSSRDQLLPTLKLSTSATLQGLSLSQLVDAPSALWSVGASVLAPVLQRSRLQAGVDVAAAQRDQALFAYEDTVRRAFTDVEDALTAIDALESQRSELDARTVAASEVLRIARSRYRNGYASYLEELDAQRAQYAAQQSLIQARAALLSASVDLYRALGGGWAPTALDGPVAQTRGFQSDAEPKGSHASWRNLMSSRLVRTLDIGHAAVSQPASTVVRPEAPGSAECSPAAGRWQSGLRCPGGCRSAGKRCARAGNGQGLPASRA